MLELGQTLGRQHAHDVVYDAAQAAFIESRAFGCGADRGAAGSDRLYRALCGHGP